MFDASRLVAPGAKAPFSAEEPERPEPKGSGYLEVFPLALRTDGAPGSGYPEADSSAALRDDKPFENTESVTGRVTARDSGRRRRPWQTGQVAADMYCIM